MVKHMLDDHVLLLTWKEFNFQDDLEDSSTVS